MSAKSSLWTSPFLWVLLVATLVTGPLVILAARPTHIVEVSIHPDDDSVARVISRGTVARSYGGPMFFEFKADVRDVSMERAALLIRPEASGDFSMQNSPKGYRVENGIVRGTAQLGSVDFPLQHDEDYSFRLVSIEGGRVAASDSGVLAEGTISATVAEIVGPDRVVIAAIGLLASLLQIIQALVVGFVTSTSRGGKPSE